MKRTLSDLQCLTSEDGRELPSEVDNGRDLVDSVLFGVFDIVDLQQHNVQFFSLIIDVFQLTEDFVAIGIVVLD